MFSKALATKLFDAFSIFRWNDRIRPVELVEMDKHALKSVLTYFIGKIEEADGKSVDWEYIVYGNVFALLKNIVLSDIKSPIIRQLKEKIS
jgi:putative hydrolase of HD superfamily